MKERKICGIKIIYNNEREEIKRKKERRRIMWRNEIISMK